MRLRFLVVSLLLAFLLFSGTAFAQTFTGLFDGYYAFNFNKPPCQCNTFITGTPSRAFDVNHQQFSLNYAELSVEQKGKPVGYRVDVGFGDAARVVNSFEPSGTDWEHIQQAYVSLHKENMTVDFGKFVTPFGAEVIETKDNWNYSRSLLFTYAIPFYHFGMRATYAMSDKATLAAYAVNGWNNVQDNNRGKTVGLQAVLKPVDKWTFTNTYMVGNESPVRDNRRHTFDSVSTYEVSKGLSAMANYDYLFDSSFSVRRKLQGIALYGKISPTGTDTGLKIVPRYEWLNDKNDFIGVGGPQRLQEGTLTIQMVSKESGTFWAEYRRDFSDQKAFVLIKKTTVEPRNYQATVEFGYTYSFTKEVK